MMRLAAALLLLVVMALPLSVRPAPPVTWLAAAGLALGGIGVLAWSVPLVTAAGALALVAHAMALAIAGPEAAPAAAIALGAGLVLLLALVHFGGRVRGAMRGPGVVVAQARQWLMVAGLGTVVAVALVMAAPPLGAALGRAPMPVVVAAAALGAVVAVAGVIALLRRETPS